MGGGLHGQPDKIPDAMKSLGKTKRKWVWCKMTRSYVKGAFRKNQRTRCPDCGKAFRVGFQEDEDGNHYAVVPAHKKWVK